MNMPGCKSAIIFSALSAQALHKNFAPGLEAQAGNATLLADTLQLETPHLKPLTTSSGRAVLIAVTLQVQGLGQGKGDMKNLIAVLGFYWFPSLAHAVLFNGNFEVGLTGWSIIDDVSIVDFRRRSPQGHLQVLLTTVAEVAYFTMMTADNACKTNLK